jgi:hypothetical protein
VLSGLSCATICYLYLTRPRRSVYASACVEGEFSEVPSHGSSLGVGRPFEPPKREGPNANGALGWCKVLRWAPGSQGEASSRR